MKTLEIKTASGTYLVVDLPEGSTNVYITQEQDLGHNCCILPAIHFTDKSDKAELLPSGSWQPIGLGKDHPKLVEEIGLLSENTVKPEYTHIEESTMEAVQRYNRQLVEQEQAEKYVFKNPVILKKNDPN